MENYYEVLDIICLTFALLGMVFMFFYPLNNKKMLEIEADLVERWKNAQND